MGHEREQAWDMAVYSLRESAQAVSDMAKDPSYQRMAKADLAEIAAAALAITLTFRQLKKDA